jgi:hypothetical protein
MSFAVFVDAGARLWVSWVGTVDQTEGTEEWKAKPTGSGFRGRCPASIV